MEHLGFLFLCVERIFCLSIFAVPVLVVLFIAFLICLVRAFR